MAKIKKIAPYDNCAYALFPFGKGMPICAYGVKIPEGEVPSIKYFYHCLKDGKCRKELIENETRSKKMSLSKNLNKGNAKKFISVTDIRPNPKNKYYIDNDEVRSVAESIVVHGQLEPGIVYEEIIDDDKHYTLISGEKRFRAISLLLSEGRHDGMMDVIVQEKPKNDFEMNNIINDANLQRKKDHKTLYFEIKQKDEYYQYLIDSGKKPEQHRRDYIASSLGISSRTVANIIDEYEGDKKKKKKSSGRREYNKEFESKLAKKHGFITSVGQKNITFKFKDTEEMNEFLTNCLGIKETYNYKEQ